MTSNIVKWIVLSLLVCFSESRDPRSVIELTKCVRMAEPLIHDPDYIFPLSIQEIENVCVMWDGFVKCVRQYTSTFLTLEQQKEFEKAIKPSMESIQQLCIQDENYQKAYLNYAPCMKKISTEQKYCGGHYNFLAKIAESSSETGPAICCGYHKFRSCALQEAARECEDGIKPITTRDGDSSHFVSSMLNRALGFLLQKCSHYEPTNIDCRVFVKDDKDLQSYNGAPDSPFGVFGVPDLKPSANQDPTHPSVTLNPKPFDNSFTWDPIPKGSFFPTDVNNDLMQGPKSQEFKGSGVPSLRNTVLLTVFVPLVLSVWF